MYLWNNHSYMSRYISKVRLITTLIHAWTQVCVQQTPSYFANQINTYAHFNIYLYKYIGTVDQIDIYTQFNKYLYTYTHFSIYLYKYKETNTNTHILRKYLQMPELVGFSKRQGAIFLTVILWPCLSTVLFLCFCKMSVCLKSQHTATVA